MKDMEKMQNDLYDEYAMILFPKMMDIVKKNKAKYYSSTSKEMKILARMEDMMRGYKGDTFIDSKEALIYNTWFSLLVDSLFTTYFRDEFERQSVISFFFVDHFFGNVIARWAAGNDTNAPFCENARNGAATHKCLFNVVEALVRTYEKIVENLGKNEVRLELTA